MHSNQDKINSSQRSTFVENLLHIFNITIIFLRVCVSVSSSSATPPGLIFTNLPICYQVRFDLSCFQVICFHTTWSIENSLILITGRVIFVTTKLYQRNEDVYDRYHFVTVHIQPQYTPLLSFHKISRTYYSTTKSRY